MSTTDRFLPEIFIKTVFLDFVWFHLQVDPAGIHRDVSNRLLACTFPSLQISFVMGRSEEVSIESNISARKLTARTCSGFSSSVLQIMCVIKCLMAVACSVLRFAVRQSENPRRSQKIGRDSAILGFLMDPIKFSMISFFGYAT